MLVGYGRYSLLQTQPGQLAPGAETVYRAADAAVEVKEQVQQWSKDAGKAVADATGAVQALTTSGAESAGRWVAETGATVAEAAGSVQAAATRGTQRVGEMSTAEQEHDKLLLGAAAAALTAAIGLAWLWRGERAGEISFC